jgi:hypothetical protein
MCPAVRHAAVGRVASGLPLVRAVLAVLGLVLSPGLLGAQTFESVGVRARGMAGAFVAVADDASAMWWNPAGLASERYLDFNVEFGRALDPQRTRAGGIAAKVLALGLSYYRLQLRDIRPPGPGGPGPVNQADHEVLSLFGVTTGQSIGRHVVLASTLRIARAGDTHGDYDIGAMAAGGGARVGVVVRHVTEPSFGTGASRFELTRQVRVGAALMGEGRGSVDQLTLALDADLTRTPTPFGESRHVAAGVEAWLRGRRVGLRGGLSASTIGDADLAPSGGVSVALVRNLYLDGAITGGSDQARRGWSVDFRVTF